MDGVTYIAWESFCRFYHLSSSSAADRALRGTQQNFHHHTAWLSLGKNAQSVFLQGHLIELIHPLIYQEEHQWMISKADCFILLDPILRADYIAGAQPIQTIIIDPAHGGSDRGLPIDGSAKTEASYTLDLAKRLQERLMKHGFYCLLTRQGDTHLSEQARVDLANAPSNAIFLNLRLNQGYSTRRGIESYTSRAHTGRQMTAAQQTLARQSALLGMTMQAHLLYSTKAHDAGLRGSYYSYLSSIRHPSCTIYLGYLSNHQEHAQLMERAYQEKLLDGIEAGVLRYVQLVQED